MIRKLRIKIQPRPELIALVKARDALEAVGRWKCRLSSPLGHPTLQDFQECWSRERATLSSLNRALRKGGAEETSEEADRQAPGVLSHILQVDLPTLAADGDSLVSLLKILIFLNKCSALYDLEVVLGNRTDTPAQALKAVRDAAREVGCRLPGARAVMSEYGVGGNAGQDAGGDETDAEGAPVAEHGVDASFDDAPPEPPRARTRRNEWGGLDDRAVASPPPGGLSESEQFLISYASVIWPCDLSHLRTVWRHAAMNLHPDRGGDRVKFQLAKDGYERLLRRLGAQD